MEKNYSYGPGCAFIGGIHPSGSRREIAIQAKTEGFGFIQRNSVSNEKTRTVILAWDIKVVSYQEARQQFENNPKILAEVESHHASRNSQVFLIAPAPEECGGVDVFPFDLVDKLRVVAFEALLSPNFRD